MEKFEIDLGELEIDLARGILKDKKKKEKRPLFTPGGRKKVDPGSKTAQVTEMANDFLASLDGEIDEVKLKEVVDYCSGGLPFERRVIYSAVYTATRHNRLRGWFYDKDSKVLRRA